ncbi:hypothetical protein, partial [Desulfobacula sp.]|uniref:sensor histidine kinase n=1 Tax=Desulfobacula sp. TaxID=2593537 RepID=UPI0025C4A718
HNEFKPGCEKRFTTFYGLVAKSGLKTKNFILSFLQRWGLVNTNLRLEQIYGPQYRLTIKSSPGKGTFITFKIPDILCEP